MPFNFKKLDNPDAILIEPRIFPDERGFFLETYKKTDFDAIGIDKPIMQINHSKSSKGVLRGLHYQKDPKVQGKFVSVVVGEVYDVIVDIRKGSPHYGQWLGVTLDSKKHHMLYVPEGFAHGFCVISEIAELIYYCTDVYSPEYERGLRWNDPSLGIKWPVQEPIIAERDASFPDLDKADINYTYEQK